MERRRRTARLDVAEPMTKAVRRRDKPRERWLLTRKTWKYMSDAGRRLIPDGAQNRQEDLLRLEANFQDICAKEPRFLLWRKSSYPGALPRQRRKKRSRGGSVRARSPSDDIPPPARPTDLFIPHTSGGRFDIAKLRREFFAGPTPAPNKVVEVRPTPEEEEESTLVELLRKYLKLEEERGSSRLSDSEGLVRALKRYLKRQSERTPADSEGSDASRRSLLENLGRYYGHSPNKDNIVQDLLTDRNLIKKLYHDLRKTKPYKGGRNGGGSGFGPSSYGSGTSRGAMRSRMVGVSRVDDNDDSVQSPPMSPPPLIEVFGESFEDKYVDCGTQTVPIPKEVLLELERLYREKLEDLTSPTSPTSPPPERKATRRRSSVDHDDVSQSVSDTIKRYLRMARKKSVDADKADRFKRINYDKNLRNIKPRAPGEVDDDGLSKGCQTEEAWILSYQEMSSVASTPTSPPSPASPSQSHSFLSTLMGRGGSTMSGGGTGGMQKSRSSSSVVQSVSKRLWRTRSRSSSRAVATWTPQGSCRWVDGSGRSVVLTDTSLLTLSEVERKALQQAALARLQQLNIGTHVKIPDENVTAPSSKPKRRAYLLKKKALTTGFFDQSRKEDKDKDSTSGAVFGVPLAQCVETERALRRQHHSGSRSSLASLSGTEKGDDSESCDSGDWGWSGGGVDEAGGGGPRVPALVTACLSHLHRHGLRMVGLFRVSASKIRVRQLREEWEQGQESALESAVCHDVATLLKEFLRDLPDPLLCRELYPAFLQTQKIRNRRHQWEAVQLLVQLLPAAHRDTLHALLAFLATLAQHAEDDHQPGNKMTPLNLATVIAPNILHRNKPNEAASADQLIERTDVINVVRQLIERETELWKLPAELLHEAYIHLAHTAPSQLQAVLSRKAEQSGGGEAGATWSRQQVLHRAAVTAEPDYDKSPSRRRARDAASDTSSASLSSAMTILTRVRSSTEECGSSGVVCARDSNVDSNDSSDYTETLNNSDDDNLIITASLHIPGAFRPPSSPATPTASPAAPPRRRSSASASSKRDSAVGSSSSVTSSPPSSPPPFTAPSPSPALAPAPAPLKVTMTSHVDIAGFARERNTSDARAVMLRQHEENTNKTKESPVTRPSSRQETIRKDDHILRRDEMRTQPFKLDNKRETRIDTRKEEIRRDDQSTKKERVLYKRGELISSARSPP